MPPEDYQPPFCFECDGEILKSGNLMVCEECGKVYTHEEYQKLTDEEAEKYIDFMKKNRQNYSVNGIDSKLGKKVERWKNRHTSKLTRTLH